MGSRLKCSLCDKKARAKGLCSYHYHKEFLRRHPGYSASKRRAYVLKYPERAKKSIKKWREANKEYLKLRHAEWRSENHEYVLAKAAEYRKSKPHMLKRWRNANPERVRIYNFSKRIKRRQAQGSHTAEEIKNLFAKQRGCCAICRCKLPMNYHRDHIVPLISGGTDYIHNVQLLCASCNQTKHAKDPIAYMQSRGFLI